MFVFGFFSHFEGGTVHNIGKWKVIVLFKKKLGHFCSISFATIPMLSTTVLPGKWSLFSEHLCQFESSTKPAKVQWSVKLYNESQQEPPQTPESFGLCCCTFWFFRNFRVCRGGSHAQVYADSVRLFSTGCRWSSTWMKTPSRRGWSFSSLKTKGQVSIFDRTSQELLLSCKSKMLTG